MNKKEARKRRSMKIRCKFRSLDTRLTVHRTLQHMYAQITASGGSEILVSASTLEKDILVQLKGNGGNKKAAGKIGEIIAIRAIKKGIKKVSFDRSGFKYHGRIRSLADSARVNGLQF